MADSHQDEIAKLEALYASNPGGRVFTHLAEAYRKAGNLVRAREIAEDGLRRHDGYASAHVVMGRIFLDMGRRDEAAAEFRRVLQLDPENRIALRGIGDYERERGSSQEALRHFRQLEQLDPGDEELSATIAALEQATAPPGAPPPAAAAPGMEYFGSFSNEPYAPPAGGQPYDSGHGYTQAGGYDAPAAPGEAGGYGEAPPPEAAEKWGEAAAGGAAGEEASAGPAEFEPLPLSLDWSGAGGADAGVESPDLRLDWDIGAGDEVVGAAGVDEAGVDEAGISPDAPGADFRLDLPGADRSGPGAEAQDPAAAWRELEEAASAALPSGEHEALPSGEHEALPSGEHEALPSGERDALPSGEYDTLGSSAEPQPSGEVEYGVGEDSARVAGAETAPDDAELGDLASVTYEWQEAGDGEAERDRAGVGAERAAADEPGYAADDGDGFGADLPAAAETEVYTETLAELYRAQGFRERAIEIYRALLADRPGDERLSMKLRELEGAPLEETAPAVAADPWHALADAMEQGAERARSDAEAHAWPADDLVAGEAAAAETERPEPEWVESVEAAWTGGAGAAGTDEGLYVPPPEEQDAAGSGVPVGQALGALLDWKPTRRPAEDPEEELLLLDEIADEAAEADVVGQAETVSSAGGVAGVDEATGPRTFNGGAAVDPLPWEAAEPPMAAAPGGQPAVEPLPWDAAEAAGGEAAAAAGPGDVGNPFEAETRRSRPESSGESEEDEDDDDLEMFRSWLQSLRR